jgi:hypothetical protein
MSLSAQLAAPSANAPGSVLIAALSLSSTGDKSSTLARIYMHNRNELDFASNSSLQRANARLPPSTPDAVRERDALAIMRRIDWGVRDTNTNSLSPIDPVSSALLHCSLGPGPWVCIDAPAHRVTQSRTVLRAAACADVVLLFLNVAAHLDSNPNANQLRATLLPTFMAIKTHLAARSFADCRVVVVLCGFDEPLHPELQAPAAIDSWITDVGAQVAAALARFRGAPTVPIVPISTITGENVMDRGRRALFAHRTADRPLWDVLTELAHSRFALEPPPQLDDKARFFISRIAGIPTSKDRFHLYGRLVSGTLLQRRLSVIIMPHNITINVERIMQAGRQVSRDVVAGDCVELVVRAENSAQAIALGAYRFGVSFTPKATAPPVREFCAEVQVASGYLKPGACCVVQCGTNRAGCKIIRIAFKTKSSAAVVVREYNARQQALITEAAPLHVARGESAVVTFVPMAPLVVESYRDNDSLSRFTLHTTDKLMCEAMGRVLSVVPWPFDEATQRQLSTDVTTLHMLQSRMLTYVTFKKWLSREYLNWHTSANVARTFPDLLSPAVAQARAANAPLLWPGKLPSELVRAHDVSSGWLFVGVGLFDGEPFVICQSAAGVGVPPIPPPRKAASSSAAASSSSSSSTAAAPVLARVRVADLSGVSDCAGATALSIALVGFHSSLPHVLALWPTADAATSALVALANVIAKLRHSESLFIEALSLISTCVSFSVPLNGVHPFSGHTALQLLVAAANFRDARTGLRDCVELLLEHNVAIDSTTGEHVLTTVMSKALDFQLVDLLRCDVRGKANLSGVALSTPVANLALIAVRGGMLTTVEAQYRWALSTVPVLRELVVRPDVDGRLLSASFERALSSSFAVDHVVHVPHENGDSVPVAVGLIRLLHPSFAPYGASSGVSELPKRFSAAEFRVFLELLMLGRTLSLDKLAMLLAGDDRSGAVTAKIRINAQLGELAAIYLLGVAPLAPDAESDSVLAAFRAQINAVEDKQRLEDYRRVVASIYSPKQDNNDRRLARALRALLFAVNRSAVLAAPSSAGLIGEDLIPEALRRSDRLAASLALDPAFSDDDEPAAAPAAASTTTQPPAVTLPGADVALVSNGRRINAHRQILALRVPYFASRFGSAFSDADSDEVVLDDLTSEAVRAMVVFVYTGTVRIAADHVLDVLACAHRLNFGELLRYCERLLAQNLDVDNVCDVLPYAEHYGAPVLKAACSVYIATWLAFGANSKQSQALRDQIATLNDAKLSAEVTALATQLGALATVKHRT